MLELIYPYAQYIIELLKIPNTYDLEIDQVILLQKIAFHTEVLTFITWSILLIIVIGFVLTFIKNVGYMIYSLLVRG